MSQGCITRGRRRNRNSARGTSNRGGRGRSNGRGRGIAPGTRVQIYQRWTSRESPDDDLAAGGSTTPPNSNSNNNQNSLGRRRHNTECLDDTVYQARKPGVSARDDSASRSSKTPPNIDRRRRKPGCFDDTVFQLNSSSEDESFYSRRRIQSLSSSSRHESPFAEPFCEYDHIETEDEKREDLDFDLSKQLSIGVQKLGFDEDYVEEDTNFCGGNEGTSHLVVESSRSSSSRRSSGRSRSVSNTETVGEDAAAADVLTAHDTYHVQKAKEHIARIKSQKGKRMLLQYLEQLYNTDAD